MATNGRSSESLDAAKAGAALDALARQLVELPILAIQMAETDAHRKYEEARLEHDAARARAREAEQAELLAETRAQVASAALIVKLGGDIMGSLENPPDAGDERARRDPTGQQAAICQIVEEAGRPLGAKEIQRELKLRTRKQPKLTAVQNQLSRMVRNDPPLLARAARGLYEPVGTTALLPPGAGKQ